MSRSTRTCKSRLTRRRSSRPHEPAPATMQSAAMKRSGAMKQDDQPPDVDRLARSMLMLHGDHQSHDEPARAANGRHGGSCSKAAAFPDDPERAAAGGAATPAGRTRPLAAGVPAHR